MRSGPQGGLLFGVAYRGGCFVVTTLTGTTRAQGPAVFFLIVPFRLIFSAALARRHFITFLMLIELRRVAVFLCLGLYCPYEWLHVVTYVLVMGVCEAALGLAIIVKISRSTGNDRVAIASLLKVGGKGEADRAEERPGYTRRVSRGYRAHLLGSVD